MNIEGIHNIQTFGFSLIIITGVIISRYLLKCHTLFQLILSIIIGISMGLFAFIIQSLILNKIFIKDKKQILKMLI